MLEPESSGATTGCSDAESARRQPASRLRRVLEPAISDATTGYVGCWNQLYSLLELATFFCYMSSFLIFASCDFCWNWTCLNVVFLLEPAFCFAGTCYIFCYIDFFILVVMGGVFATNRDYKSYNR